MEASLVTSNLPCFLVPGRGSTARWTCCFGGSSTSIGTRLYGSRGVRDRSSLVQSVAFPPRSPPPQRVREVSKKVGMNATEGEEPSGRDTTGCNFLSPRRRHLARSRDRRVRLIARCNACNCFHWHGQWEEERKRGRKSRDRTDIVVVVPPCFTFQLVNNFLRFPREFPNASHSFRENPRKSRSFGHVNANLRTTHEYYFTIYYR